MKAGASVITTASVQAYYPSEGLLDYATTKAAIVAYTKALAKKLPQRPSRRLNGRQMEVNSFSESALVLNAR